jgi:uncharacterized tellurite resistance protein B-like protein
MLAKLQSLFKGSSLVTDAAGKPAERDLQIATGLLLLEVAGTDSDYAPEETREIFRVMEQEFQMESNVALSVLEAADELRRNKDALADLVKLINQHFDQGQRERIYSLIWRVIMADGKIDKFERRFAAQLKSRLQLTDEQEARARKLAGES